jgi:hypothetical protein
MDTDDCAKRFKPNARYKCVEARTSNFIVGEYYSTNAACRITGIGGRSWDIANLGSRFVEKKSSTNYTGQTVKTNVSDGGPSSYYDFDAGWNTFNDFMEHKAKTQWGSFSLHLKDVGKALCRFGIKAGTTDAYDARKIIYSGLRILGMIEGNEAMRKELVKLLDDKQFK